VPAPDGPDREPAPPSRPQRRGGGNGRAPGLCSGRTVSDPHQHRILFMTSHPRAVSASIDPVRLDKLAEVAVKVGLQLAEGQDLVMTAPVTAAAARAPHHRARLQGRRRPRDHHLCRTRRRPSPASATAKDASFDRAAGWLYSRAWPRPTSQQCRPPRDFGRQPDDAGRMRAPKGVARQPRQFDAAYQPGARAHRRLRHQLEHRLLSQPRLGQADVFRATRRTSRWPSSPRRSFPRRA
jgi:hypothetical protein